TPATPPVTAGATAIPVPSVSPTSVSTPLTPTVSTVPAGATAPVAATIAGAPAGGAAPTAGANLAFDKFWERALHDGFIPNTALPEKSLTPAANLASQLAAPSAPTGSTTLEIVFEPDPTIWDGRFANNTWLQELPKPISKLTWDNAALVSPALAQRLGVADEDQVELRYKGRSVLAPVLVLPGQPEAAVTVYLGYGRRAGGQVAPDIGFNAYSLRTSDAPWFGYGLEIRKAGGSYSLATARKHFSLEGRDLLHDTTLEQLSQNTKPGQNRENSTPPADLYPEIPYNGHKWGMSINLNSCIGCNACVLACQAENNIPVVGKDQVERGREMHWLRIDTYFQGNIDNPQTAFEPVPCMHCEHAPCEPVCPTGATVHSSEGLNDMVYNRCVGTRYCSNNCPYKVRRFNFYQYVDKDVLPLRLMQNPDVTVRDRGVMEKCTYCVQRINRVRIQAEVEGRSIQDGEIKTACQQACPTNAIIFGDINQQNSQVSKLKAEPRNFALLEELNTRPRTTYLAKVRNPNPAIKE
ncbi:MAG TPA: 4Fe-4S dicluster domain-containing protein, partial [Anaerolineales bacterium]